MKTIFFIFMLLICALFAVADKEATEIPCLTVDTYCFGASHSHIDWNADDFSENFPLAPEREIKITGDLHYRARKAFEFEVEKVLFEKLIEYKNDILKDSLAYKVYGDPYPVPTLDGFILWLEKDLNKTDGK